MKRLRRFKKDKKITGNIKCDNSPGQTIRRISSLHRSSMKSDSENSMRVSWCVVTAMKSVGKVSKIK
jgi:hypothetical protein